MRRVVRIDEELCDGCGLCVPSCAEGALQVIDGTARLLNDSYCDGLGACLGECPQGAITVEERETVEFDEEAVKVHLAELKMSELAAPASLGPRRRDGEPACGCPGSQVRQLGATSDESPAGTGDAGFTRSELWQWPVQLHLVPPTAPYFSGADVLLAADCTAYAIGDFHRSHLKGKRLAVACPKLDRGMDIYLAKLTAMIDLAKINTLTVLTMEVPCCQGLVRLAAQAVSQASRRVPVRSVVVGIRGEVLSEDWL